MFKSLTNCLLAIALACTGMVGIGTVGTQVSAQDTSLILQQNLHRVQEWLGSGPNTENWRRFLDLGDLESLSALGGQADSPALQQVLSRFDSQAHGLDHPHFIALRNAIENQIKAIESAQPGNYSIDEKEGFSEIPNSRIEQSKQDLLVELYMLKQHFTENLWGIDRPRIMRQLEVNELIALLEEVNFLDPNTEFEGNDRFDQRKRKVVLVVQKLRALKSEYRVASSLMGSFYIQLAEERLDSLERLLTYAFDEATSKRLYTRSIAGFNEHVAKLSDVSDRRAQLLVGQGLGLLSHQGQYDDVAMSIRREYSRPNFKLTVTEDLVNIFASRVPVQDARWIDEVVLGNRIQGFAYTNGNIFVDFLDDPLQAFLSINLNGTIDSNGKTKQGPIAAYSNSFAQFSGQRTIAANVGGLIDFEATANADLTSEFLGTNCSLNLVNRIAVNQYLQKKLHSEQIGSDRARTQVYEQFLEQTTTELNNGKNSIADAHLSYFNLLKEVSQFRYRISKAGKPEFDDEGNLYEPDDVIDPIKLPEGFISTTDKELNVYAFLEDWNRLGAINNAPEYQFPSDIRVQLHESMLANLVAPFLDGKTFKSSEFGEIIESFAGEVPEEFELSGENEFTITFESGQPIQFAFEDDRISIIVNGSNFEKDGRSTGPMFVRINFKLVSVEGELKLIRDGAPVIDFSEEGTRSVEQITARSLIQDQLDAVTKDDPMDGAVALPDNLIPLDILSEIEGFEGADEAANFRLVQLKSELGWLTLGWSYSPQTPGSASSVQSYLMDTPAIHPLSLPSSKDDFILNATPQGR